MIDKLTDEDKIEIIYNSLSKIEEISFTDKRVCFASYFFNKLQL